MFNPEVIPTREIKIVGLPLPQELIDLGITGIQGGKPIPEAIATIDGTVSEAQMLAVLVFLGFKINDAD